jgi:hypothetical protein
MGEQQNDAQLRKKISKALRRERSFVDPALLD